MPIELIKKNLISCESIMMKNNFYTSNFKKKSFVLLNLILEIYIDNTARLKFTIKQNNSNNIKKKNSRINRY